MQKFTLTNDDGWVLVSSAAVCRIQVLNSWHTGILRVHVGTSLPNNTSPFFEIVQGENWIKTTDVDNVYAYAWRATKEHPLTITVSDKVDGVASGGSSGGGSSGLTNAELRASPVDVSAPATVAKLEELRTQLTTLLGNTDTLETLNNNTNALLTTMLTYVDQLETLSSSIIANTTDLSALLTNLGVNTDGIEGLLTAISTKLPATLGKKVANDSLPVTLASDEGLINAINAITTELQQKADLSETQPVSIASLPLPAGSATAANQALVLTALESILTSTQATVNELVSKADGTATDPVMIRPVISTFTPALIRTTTAGTVAAGAFEISIANIGEEDGTVLGTVIPPDSIVTFRAPFLGSTLGAVAYNGTGTVLLISTIVEV